MMFTQEYLSFRIEIEGFTNKITTLLLMETAPGRPSSLQLTRAQVVITRHYK